MLVTNMQLMYNHCNDHMVKDPFSKFMHREKSLEFAKTKLTQKKIYSMSMRILTMYVECQISFLVFSFINVYMLLL